MRTHFLMALGVLLLMACLGAGACWALEWYEDAGQGSSIDMAAATPTMVPTRTPTPTRTVRPPIYVPKDFARIQLAIDNALNGDLIIVSEGTYYENIDFKGKNVSLQSSSPSNPQVVASTIIDGKQTGPVVKFAGGESSGCVLIGFTIRNGLAVNGGGIVGGGTYATIKRNVITANKATSYGGGLYQCNGVIQNCTIESNESAVYGGALYQCNAGISSNIISNNKATSNGGGLYGCNGAIQGNRVSGNIATGGNGGGFYNCLGSISHNDISSNESGGSGGGLYGCNGSISHNTISQNKASYGGGLYLCDGSIFNNVVSDNQGQNGGGGFGACSQNLYNNVVRDNTAQTGAGFYECTGFIYNNLVYRNHALGLGGGFYNHKGILLCNTVSLNTASSGGGGTPFTGGVITNCIFWGNYASDPEEIPTSITPTYSCIQAWTGQGAGNITTDPRFVNSEAGDFHLKFDSPCIDAGVTVSNLKLDAEERRRPINGASAPRGDSSDLDMGALEFDPSDQTPGFTLTALEPTQVLAQGEKPEFTLAVLPKNGFGQKVQLTLLEPNVNSQFVPNLLMPPFSTTLMLDPALLSASSGTLRVRASNSTGDITRELELKYEVASGLSMWSRRTQIELGESTEMLGRLLPAVAAQPVVLSISDVYPSTTNGPSIKSATVSVLTDYKGRFTYSYYPPHAGLRQCVASTQIAATGIQSPPVQMEVAGKKTSISLKMDVAKSDPAQAVFAFSGRVDPAPSGDSATAELVVTYLGTALGPASLADEPRILLASEPIGVPLNNGMYEASIPLTQSGIVRVRARWWGEQPDLLGAESPAMVFSAALPVVGASGIESAIQDSFEPGGTAIAAGGTSTNLQPSTRDYLSNFSYSVLRDRRFSDARLVYMNDNTSQDVNWDGQPDDAVVDVAESTLAGLSDALSQVAQTAPADSPVSVFLVAERGDGAALSMADGSQIEAAELSGMLLDQFGTTRDIRIIVDSSNSGAFCQALSAPNRTIITSASGETAAYMAGGLLSFTQLFMTQVQTGWNIQDSFGYASDYLRAVFGYYGAPSPAIFAAPNYDPSALYCGISSDAPDMLPPDIEDVCEPTSVGSDIQSSIFARVSDDIQVYTVQATLTKPNGDSALFALAEDAPGSGKYTAKLGTDTLDQIGLYTLVFVAMDSSRNVSEPKGSQIMVVNPADLNADGYIDAKDLCLLIDEMEESSSLYDVVSDGKLDFKDLLALATCWEP